MRKSGARGNRAKRRHQPRAEPPKAPEGWPDVDLLGDALEVNDLARRFLEEMRPETVRTILKRMETPTRKAVFERHNIPVTKVGLRSAGQVLTLLRSDESPAESPILGTMLNPAADLFHHGMIDNSETTGLRLKLVDLALSLLIANDSVIDGLRTWHRWAQPEFEDLTLAVVIGLKCSRAVVAAAYLAGSHADVAEKYEALREEYPQMPEILTGTLTATNPLSRYLAARPDRKVPSTAAELRAMVAEDSRVRRAEVGQAQRERDRRRTNRRPEAADDNRPEADDSRPEAEPDSTTETARDSAEPEPAAPKKAPVAHRDRVEAVDRSRPVGPALPGVADWAAAVSASKRMTQRLVAGEPPTPEDLEPLRLIHDQVTQMAGLLTHIVGEPVEPSRSSIDANLTLVLSDPELSDRLQGMPVSRGDVLDRLERLRADSGSAEGKPPNPPTGTPSDDDSTEQPDVDLSDLDSILRGELGSRLTALAGAGDATGSEAPEPGMDSGSAVDAARTTPSAVSGDAEPTAEGRELMAVGMQIRTPQGELAQRFHHLANALLDSAGEADLLVLRCASLPVSLIDPTAGGVPFLGEPIDQLSGCPTVLSFRDAIAELCRQGVQPYDPAMVRMAALSANLEQTALSAKDLLEAAETRTLKYDKATKVYRHWMSTGGTLRPLIDALRRRAPVAAITDLAEECRKLGASRAVDETAAVLIDANRTKIVAGARKTLTDKFGEVLGLADTASGISAEIEAISREDRSAAWRFDALSRFRQQAHSDMAAIESELSQLDGVPEGVRALLLRAIGLAINPDPLVGPEPSASGADSTGARR